MKQQYIIPQTQEWRPALLSPILSLSAPNEGITDGGEGRDDDDPTVKLRDDAETWGNLW